MRMRNIANLWLRGYRTKFICSNIGALMTGYLAFNGKFDYKGVIGAAYNYGYDFNLNMDLRDYVDPLYASTPNQKEIDKMGEEWDKFSYDPYKYPTIRDREITKRFTFSYPSYGGYWTTERERDSRVILDIDFDGRVNMYKCCGVDPTVEQVAAMVAAATIRTGNYDRNRRKNAFTVSRNGHCSHDYYLKIYKKVGTMYHLKFETEKLHISTFDKIGTIPSLWKGDLVEIFRSLGFNMPIRKRESNAILRNMGIRFDRPPKRQDLLVDTVDYDPHNN